MLPGLVAIPRLAAGRRAAKYIAFTQPSFCHAAGRTLLYRWHGRASMAAGCAHNTTSPVYLMPRCKHAGSLTMQRCFISPSHEITDEDAAAADTSHC